MPPPATLESYILAYLLRSGKAQQVDQPAADR